MLGVAGARKELSMVSAGLSTRSWPNSWLREGRLVVGDGAQPEAGGTREAGSSQAITCPHPERARGWREMWCSLRLGVPGRPAGLQLSPAPFLMPVTCQRTTSS